MPMDLTADVREKLDAHLDAVERALLAAGSSREHRRGVVDDLEAQILDMLAARSPSPSVADLDAVLATLDPPAAYGQAAAGDQARPAAPVSAPPRPVPVARPRYSKLALAGLICILLSLLPLPFLMLAGFFLAPVAMRTSVAAPSTIQLTGPDGMKMDLNVGPATNGPPASSIQMAGPNGMNMDLRVGSGPDATPDSSIQMAGPNGMKMDLRVGSGADAAPASSIQMSGPEENPTAARAGPGTIPTPVPQMAMHSQARLSPLRSWAGLMVCLSFVLVPLGLAGTILGWIAFAQICATRGKLRGLGLALFDGLFYPAMVLVLGLWNGF